MAGSARMHKFDMGALGQLVRLVPHDMGDIPSVFAPAPHVRAWSTSRRKSQGRYPLFFDLVASPAR